MPTAVPLAFSRTAVPFTKAPIAVLAVFVPWPTSSSGKDAFKSLPTLWKLLALMILLLQDVPLNSQSPLHLDGGGGIPRHQMMDDSDKFWSLNPNNQSFTKV